MFYREEPPRYIPRKRCSENMEQIYRRIPIPKCDFIKITLRRGCSSVNLLHIFRTPFTKNTSGCLLLSIESVASKFYSKTNVSSTKKLVCHFIDHDNHCVAWFLNCYDCKLRNGILFCNSIWKYVWGTNSNFIFWHKS